MGPREFRETVVAPNVREFRNYYGDLRHAFNAVAAVDALAGHIFLWCQINSPSMVVGLKDDGAYKTTLANADVDFRLLRDVAKAQKHVHLTQWAPLVTKSAQIQPVSLGWGQARWGEMRWGGPPQVVVVTNAGENRTVEFLVGRGLDVLDREMTRFGIP